MNKKLVLALFNENHDSVECAFQPVRCDRCKHWAVGDEDGEARTCLRVESIAPLVGDPDPSSVLGAYTVDFEQCIHGNFPLETFPGFGCSLFEAKS